VWTSRHGANFGFGFNHSCGGGTKCSRGLIPRFT
jgi:hypothetical protein